MTKRALVLSGGGARGAFQVGMLQHLIVDQGLDFQVLRGVSVGALNAAVLAQAGATGGQGALADQVAALEQLWTKSIRGNASVYRRRWGGWLAVALGADSLYRVDPLERLLRRHLDAEQLRTSGRDFRVGAVSLVEGLYREFAATDDGDFLERILASASIPLAFPFRRTGDGDAYVDGGVRNITPLASAFDAQPDEIYLLLASRLVRDGDELPQSGVDRQSVAEWRDARLGTRVGGLQVLARTIELLTDEIYLDDIRAAIKWNQVCDAVDHARGVLAGADLPQDATREVDQVLKRLDRRHVRLHVIAPQVLYGHDNQATQFDPASIQAAIDHGRAVAKDPRRWLWPPVPSA